jgi:hypothetical protein
MMMTKMARIKDHRSRATDVGESKGGRAEADENMDITLVLYTHLVTPST